METFPSGLSEFLRAVSSSIGSEVRSELPGPSLRVRLVRNNLFRRPAGEPFVLNSVTYASSTSTSTGALGWMLRGTQGLSKVNLVKVFSFSRNVKGKELQEACPFLRRRQLNTTSFERGAKFRGTERGSEVEVHATHHHNGTALSPACFRHKSGQVGRQVSQVSSRSRHSGQRC